MLPDYEDLWGPCPYVPLCQRSPGHSNILGFQSPCSRDKPGVGLSEEAVALSSQGPGHRTPAHLFPLGTLPQRCQRWSPWGTRERTGGRLGSSLTLRQRAGKRGANCRSLSLLGAGRQGSACPAQACRGRPRPAPLRPRRPALRASAGPLHGPGRAHWASKLRGLTPRALTSASRRRPPPSDNGPRAAAAVSSAGPGRRPQASRCPVGLQVRLPDLDVGLFYLFTFLRLLSSVFGFLS